MTGTGPEQSALYLMELGFGYLYSAALAAVAELGVADHLADGPRSPAELAEATGTQAPYLHRVLRLVATRGVLREDDDGRFHLTERGAALRTDAVPSVRAALSGLCTDALWQPPGRLVSAVREGRSTFEEIFGVPIFEHLARHGHEGAAFHRGMANLSEFVGRVDLDRSDFPPGATVVDVGGGQGGLLLDVLRAMPDLRGILFERDEEIQRGHRLGELGAADRYRVVGGDFFTAVPPGDVYLLKYILHDWPDDRCIQILRNCRDAMAPDGRILVVESLIPPGNEPHVGKSLDILMMVAFTGRERGEAEFARLFTAADLRLTRVVPGGPTLSILEALPV